KGRSISVIRNDLPLNSNLAMAQAAATPKMQLSGTAMAATIRVRRTASSASGSVTASRATPQPRLNASLNTATSGRKSTSSRKPSATAISAQRASGRSAMGSRKRGAWPACFPWPGPRNRLSLMAEPPSAPRLDQVDRQEDNEGEHQHDRADRGRRGIVELL